jgi:hypothetical protein
MGNGGGRAKVQRLQVMLFAAECRRNVSGGATCEVYPEALVMDHAICDARERPNASFGSYNRMRWCAVSARSDHGCQEGLVAWPGGVTVKLHGGVFDSSKIVNAASNCFTQLPLPWFKRICPDSLEQRSDEVALDVVSARSAGPVWLQPAAGHTCRHAHGPSGRAGVHCQLRGIHDQAVLVLRPNGQIVLRAVIRHDFSLTEPVPLSSLIFVRPQACMAETTRSTIRGDRRPGGRAAIVSSSAGWISRFPDELLNMCSSSRGVDRRGRNFGVGMAVLLFVMLDEGFAERCAGWML